MTWLLGIGIAVAAVTIPRQAQACHTETFCVDIETDFEDNVYGDYAPLVGEEIIVPARGVRMVIIPPPPEVAREVFADQNGCFTLLTEFTTGFRLVVYPEALVGQDQNIHVCTYISEAEFDQPPEQNVPGPCEGEMMDPWVFPINGMELDDEAHCQIPPSDGWPMFGMALEVIERIDSHTAPRLTGIHEMRLGTFAPSEGSTFESLGAYGTRPNVYFNPFGVKKKFLIAHEIGHWFHNSWAAMPYYSLDPPFFYEWTGLDVPCMFINVGLSDSHGIRSAEYAHGAFFEGYAHFLSTYAFDDPDIPEATFRYYKEIAAPENPTSQQLDIVAAYQDLRDDEYRVNMLGTLGGPLAWTQNMCLADWNATDPEMNPLDLSSEIDWLRFWLQFLHHDATGVPTAKPMLAHVRLLLEFYEAQSGLPSTGVDYPGLLEIMSNEANTELYPYLERFESFAEVNGVYNLATMP